MRESELTPDSDLVFGSEVTIDQIADSFAERMEAGENPTIEEYKKKYPHLAERIDAVLPALVMLGDVRSEPAGRKLVVDDSIPEILGEYHIIQEIGRGGMGIVFEARHITMGRRVALKILPRAIAEKPGYLDRFHTEARSAARLHHTNIVPVFDEGEAEGLHYYAMQFIRGDNLDRVIDDLKRLRENKAAGDTAKEEFGNETDILSRQFAASLNEGRSLAPAGEYAGNGSVHNRTERLLADTQAVDNHGSPRSTPDDSSAGSGGLSDSIFGADDSISVARSGNQYHRRVAAVGVQVAEALEYAHNHNVLHRDVKPANLILDTEGRVWVTDFGLAKLDEHDLTGTGDIIGTLRYMAPERFSGVADRRSDIYSLGLSLYELCTLEYAFRNIDQADLVKNVSTRRPLAPRNLDETIPRDLETIILKAVSSDPARRYSTAEEMAGDLKLFLADKPIHARRASLVERLWRVCRRNPVLSSLSACVAILLCVVAIGSVNFAWYQAKQTLAEIGLRKESQKNLYHSLIDQVRMRRYIGRIGQRYVSLDAVERATALLPELDLHPDEYERCRLDLRNEAIAAMALTDLRRIWSRDIGGGWGDWKTSALDRNYTRLAEAHGDGSIRIIDVTADSQDNGDNILLTLPPPQDLEPHERTCWSLKMSPDGRWIAANHHKPNAVYQQSHLYVYDLENPEVPFLKKKGIVDFDFSHKNSVLGLTSISSVEILSLETSDVLATVEMSANATFGGTNPPRDDSTDDSLMVFPPRLIRMSHEGTQFAVSERGGNGLEIWSLDDEPVATWSTRTEHHVTALDWNSTRKILVAGTWKGRLYCWRDSEPALSLALHQAEVVQAFLHPENDYIASYSEDSSVRLTNFTAQEQALRVDRSTILFNTGFSSDGRLCHTNRAENKLGFWEIAEPALRTYSNSNRFGRTAHYHPEDAGIMARGYEGGIAFWDLEARCTIAEIESNRFDDFAFSPDGRWLYTSGFDGLQRWPLALGNGVDRIVLGEPEQIIEQATRKISVAGSGDAVFTSIGFNPVSVDSETGEKLQNFSEHRGLSAVRLTCDSQWLVSGTEKGNGVYVWNAETGEETAQILPSIVSARPSTHPLKGDVFATGGGDLIVWRIRDDGTVVMDLNTGIEAAFCRYTSNGSLLAAKTAGDQLTLIDPDTGHPLAFFETADSGRLVDARFSPDGNSIAMSCFDNLQIWDVSMIREELVRLGLDW